VKTVAGISVAAYARVRGVSRQAVEQRIGDGRLTTSVNRSNGRWRVIDVERANHEWDATGRQRIDQMNGHAAPSKLAEATMRERRARAQMIEFQLAVQKGEYERVRDVEARWARAIVAARTVLLALPSRAKSRMPHLSGGDLATWDRLIREGLETLAAGHHRPRAQEKTR
jgi:hypothetical protein